MSSNVMILVAGKVTPVRKTGPSAVEIMHTDEDAQAAAPMDHSLRSPYL